MNAFKKVALEVSKNLQSHLAVSDADSEWQRVNTYIADVLKDAHVLYAKLARLQGDFAGSELENLEKISENVLDIGGKLATFSKAFYEGKAKMSDTEAFGAGESSFDVMPEASPSPPQEAPPKSESDEEKSSEDSSEDESDADVDVEFDYETEEK
jgi:hypothetical protein